MSANEQFFAERADGWLSDALFCQDRHRAAAAASNLMKALRLRKGQDAALLAMADFPHLTQAFLPRLWELRGQVIGSRCAGARARASRPIDR